MADAHPQPTHKFAYLLLRKLISSSDYLCTKLNLCEKPLWVWNWGAIVTSGENYGDLDKAMRKLKADLNFIGANYVDWGNMIREGNDEEFL